MKTNENTLDRFLRMVIGIIAFLIAFFWVGGTVQIILFILAGVMLFTSIVGFCPLYTLLHISTNKKPSHLSKKAKRIMGVVTVAILIGGSILSIFFSKKIFLEDFSEMNTVYKQLLFDTGKEKRAESIKDYELLMPIFTDFVEKYSTYTPWSLKGDSQFVSDMIGIQQLLTSLKPSISEGNLTETHKELEKVRSIFQEILKRNDFSLVTVALVDFHDVMELLIVASDEKDSQKVLNIYPSADEKLREVETYLNDEGVQLIRSSLDQLIQLAKDSKNNELSTQAQVLKTNFIKVYLKN